MNRFLVVCTILASLLVWTAEPAEARSFRRAVPRRYAPRAARPVTGYGANLHRRFVLKQELKRVQRGQPVRFRGNIRW